MLLYTDVGLYSWRHVHLLVCTSAQATIRTLPLLPQPDTPRDAPVARPNPVPQYLRDEGVGRADDKLPIGIRRSIDL